MVYKYESISMKFKHFVTSGYKAIRQYDHHRDTMNYYGGWWTISLAANKSALILMAWVIKQSRGYIKCGSFSKDVRAFPLASVFHAISHVQCYARRMHDQLFVCDAWPIQSSRESLSSLRYGHFSNFCSNKSYMPFSRQDDKKKYKTDVNQSL